VFHFVQDRPKVNYRRPNEVAQRQNRFRLPSPDSGNFSMPEFRLYRLRADDSIINCVEFTGPDDAAATAEAIRIDHSDHIEIWNGSRKVSRVAPKDKRG
jgi:hypothetical protein